MFAFKLLAATRAAAQQSSKSHHFVQYSTCRSTTQTELIAALPWKQWLRERTSSISLCGHCLSYLSVLFNDAVNCEDYTASVINA
jgi:hypothetical protein